jgi:2-polyprenyl-3-methyl-5-hydroxy-6-metoxy-1,4-benzoquinol methylase
MKSMQLSIMSIIHTIRPKKILDAPCGDGWFGLNLNYSAIIDGIDLYQPKASSMKSYRKFRKYDLDFGIPFHGNYDAIVCCEGIEHIGNPDLLIKSAKKSLNKNGMLIISTPNTLHPASKLQFLIRGSFPGFPYLIGKIKAGSHMHISPMTFPQLYLLLKKNNFKEIKLHSIQEKKPKRLYEYFFGIPQFLYFKYKAIKSKNAEVKDFFIQAGSKQSIYGRRLVVSAKN